MSLVWLMGHSLFRNYRESVESGIEIEGGEMLSSGQSNGQDQKLEVGH